MTDLQKLIALLDGWKVSHELTQYDEHQDLVVEQTNENADTVCGYCGFYTIFEFTLAGEFLTMGAYE